MKSADYWVDEIDDIFMNTSRNMQWPRVREVRALVEAIRSEFREAVLVILADTYGDHGIENAIAMIEKLGKGDEK